MVDGVADAAGLRRILTPFDVMLLTFSALSPVVSFYIGGNVVLHIAGTGAALAYLFGGMASAILALIFAEIGAAFPRAGGVYPSLAALLGPGISFPYVIIGIPLAFASVAFTALGLGDYVRVLSPGMPLLATAGLSIILSASIALFNIRLGAIVTGIFLVLEGVALVVLTGMAARHPVRSLTEVILHPVMLSHGALVATPIAALALAAVSGLWATAGANWALYFAEEMHEASQRIGRVIAWTGALAAFVIAAPMVFMVLAMGDVKAVLSAEAPIAAYLKSAGGPLIGDIVAIGVIAAILNALIANVLAYGRYFYSTGRDGMWIGPINRFLAALHPSSRSPIAATAVVTVMSIVAMLVGEKALVIFLSGNVSDYLLVSLAIFVGRRKAATGIHYRLPMHPVIPVFGLGVTAASMIADWMDPDAGRPSIVILTVLFLAAFAYFHFRLRQTSTKWLVAGG